jgi:hypothetical protein
MNKILIVSILLLISSCANCNYDKTYSLDSHSCPKPGHGRCYLCDDPLESGKFNRRAEFERTRNNGRNISIRNNYLNF